MNAQPRILVVDDDISITDLLSDLFEVEGFKVQVCNSSKDVLYLARQFLPDVLVLDIMMPEFDGYDVCRYFKSDPQLRFTRIIVLSARDTLKSRLDCYKAGSDTFLAKPFEIDELREIVRLHLSSKLMHEEILREARETSMLDPVSGSYSWKYMERRLQDELKRAERHQRPLSLILIDLDRFDLVNERYGFDFGNEVLSVIAQTVRAAIRESDILSRYQDSFLLLLPETDTNGAENAVARIEEAFKTLDFPDRKRFTLSATIVHNTVNGGKPELILANMEERLRKAQSRRLGKRG